jgi:hypothetical protein
MSKKVNFAARPAASSPAADQWVSERSAASAINTPVAMKRLTIDLEASKHKRFKTVCAQQGLQMADELRRLVDQRIAEIERGQGA